MKIKANSKPYNQLKKYLEQGQTNTGQTLVAYTNAGLSKVRYVWDMLWSGLFTAEPRARLRYNQDNPIYENDVVLPDGSNDSHVETALLHILRNQD